MSNNRWWDKPKAKRKKNETQFMKMVINKNDAIANQLHDGDYVTVAGQTTKSKKIKTNLKGEIIFQVEVNL